MVYYLGHGDTKQVILFPASMRECFEFGWRAFDLSERLQAPIFVLSDLDLGMNLWMTEPFDYPTQPMDRGKVLTAEDLAQLGQATWDRYGDPDGDGIGPRTLPGTNSPKAAYFTRGSGHNRHAIYTERADDWEANMARLGRKFAHARTLVPAPVIDETPGAEIGLVAYGSTDPALVEARAMLTARGIKTSYLRLRALPTTAAVNDYLTRYPRIYVVENNTDGQLAKILQTETPDHAGHIKSVAHSDGLPLTARWIAQAIVEQER
jgi:2-oxoglutarate ferredoxin oxidoreductase subunit alpha